jgi:hypothetical protein
VFYTIPDGSKKINPRNLVRAKQHEAGPSDMPETFPETR